MKITGKKGLGKILKIILIIGFIISIPMIITSPMLLHHTRNSIYSGLIIYPNGILMLGIIYQFIKLFKSLEENKPFTIENVKIIKTTSIISLIMSILWLIDLLFMIFIMKNTYINYILVMAFLSLLFFGVAIALYILKELLYQATKYKEENDLTV